MRDKSSSDAASRRRLRGAALRDVADAADPSKYDALLADARRLFGAAGAFRAAPPAARSGAGRLALQDELTALLEALRRAHGALGEKLNHNARAAGAMRAYVRGGATAPPRRG